jgi:hypothetical protein
MAGLDEAVANKAWFLCKVIEMRREYLASIADLRRNGYYEAWCKFEQIEIGLMVLQRNAFYSCEKFGIAQLAEQVTRWQSLYPYRLFFSPEHIVRREECSICGKDVNPWSSCRHVPFQVYFGRECHRIVKEFEVISISLVLDPVQKYSVARVFTKNEFGEQVDQFDYSPVKFVVERIDAAFSEWQTRWTDIYQPHSFFQDIPHDAPCPCNSEQLYSDCCLKQPGVRTPHLDIIFDKPPPGHLPTFVHSTRVQKQIASAQAKSAPET